MQCSNTSRIHKKYFLYLERAIKPLHLKYLIRIKNSSVLVRIYTIMVCVCVCIKTQVLLYSTVILMRNKCRNRYFMILCVQITIGMCRGNKLVEVFRIRCAEVGGGESCLLLRLLNLNKCSLPLACRLFLAHFRDVKLFTFMSQHNTPLKILAT